MKLIINIFKGLSILYWVLAASLFITMVFFPRAIDALHTGYNDFLATVPASSEVLEESSIVEESSIIDESSIEETSSSEDVVSSEDSSSEEATSSEETSSSEDVVSSEDSSSEEIPTSEPLRANPGNSSEEDDVTCLALECEEETGGVDPLPEEEIELTYLTREEFVSALESILVYSALFMLPFTILVFSFGAKLASYSKPETAEVVEEVVETPTNKVSLSEKKNKKEVEKKSKQISIGLTGLRVKK
jgi:hypothetical protein